MGKPISQEERREDIKKIEATLKNKVILNLNELSRNVEIPQARIRKYHKNGLFDLHKFDGVPSMPPGDWTPRDIRVFRKRRPEKFSENLGITRATVSSYESGKIGNISRLVDKIFYVYYYGGDIVNFKKDKKEREVSYLNYLAEEGLETLKDLTEFSGIPYHDVIYYRGEGLINLHVTPGTVKGRKRFIPSKKWMKGKIPSNQKWFDDKICEENEEKTYQTVADDFERELDGEITRAWIAQYIEDNGLKEIWVESKRSPGENRQRVVNSLMNHLVERIKSEGCEEVVEYVFGEKRYRNKNVRRDRFGDIFTLVKAYKSAEAEGEKVSFQKLADISGVNSASYAQNVLSEMGLPSLNWSRFNRKRTSKQYAQCNCIVITNRKVYIG